MLQVQVSYWTLLENVRHNKVSEGISRDTLTESIRHNREMERQGNESVLQNWENVSISKGRLSNELAQTEISKQQLKVAQEKNKLQSRANDIAYMNAMSNASNAATNKYKATTERNVGYGNLAVSRQNALSQSEQASASAKQADNSWKANQIREKELKQRKTEMWVNAASNTFGNLLKLGGALVK